MGTASSTEPPFRIIIELGGKIANHRLSRNISQKSLAYEAGVSERTLARLEAGRSTNLESFVRVLSALDLTAGLLAVIPDRRISPAERVLLASKRRQRAHGELRPTP